MNHALELANHLPSPSSQKHAEVNAEAARHLYAVLISVIYLHSERKIMRNQKGCCRKRGSNKIARLVGYRRVRLSTGGIRVKC
jgi:hypothetical protein